MTVAWSENLRLLADRYGDSPAVFDGLNQRLSYRQLSERAHGLAVNLIKHGIKPGQALASLLPNGIDAVWVAYGIRLTGATEVPMSWSYTSEEIAWCAKLAKFNRVLTLNDKVSGLQALGLQAQDIGAIEMEDEGMVLPAIASELPGRILFTSGTTGKPKGVIYSHGRRWIGEQVQKSTLPFVPHPGARIVLMTPFVHGASLLTFAWCDFGAEVVLLDGVNIQRLQPLLAAGQLKAIFAPPTVLAKITTAFEGQIFSGVRCIFTGTQALTAALYEKASRMFGPVVRVTYGKSECINPITISTPQQTEAFFKEKQRGAGVGWPAPGVEIRIAEPVADALDGEIQDGEISLRAPQMSDGLIDQNGFVAHGPEGWHATGDLGYFDDQGRLILTGRIADVIKTGGYRVNPDEIEAVLSGNTRCGQICVTSVASDYWGEVIVAVAEHGAEGWIDAAQQLLASMSRHKRPRIYLAVPELPRNPQGKLSRKKVSQLILKTHQLFDGPYPELRLIDNALQLNRLP
ncbi:MAG: class I adenylate-forming enzyme family protein [Burkholderiaceae bacterium]